MLYQGDWFAILSEDMQEYLEIESHRRNTTIRKIYEEEIAAKEELARITPSNAELAQIADSFPAPQSWYDEEQTYNYSERNGASSVHQLSQGQVVDVSITDPNGRNTKIRPAVVLTDASELTDDSEIIVVAISTKFTLPLRSDYVKMPWSYDGRVKTGLVEPCVAKCHWLAKVTKKQIVSVRGWLPSAVMVDIMRHVTKT